MSQGDDSWQANDNRIIAKEMTRIEVPVAHILQFINEVEAVETLSQLLTQT